MKIIWFLQACRKILISLFRLSNRSRLWCCGSEVSELLKTVALSVSSRRFLIESAVELMTSRLYKWHSLG